MTNRLKQLSRRDLERLSAYLDGELTASEAQDLEHRLEHEPIMREALEELRATRDLLGAMPEVRIPRNFVLSPEMVGQVERGWRYPVLQLATALAAFAFLLVVGFDAITSQGLGGASAPMMAEAPVAEEAAPPEALLHSDDQAEAELQAPQEEQESMEGLQAAEPETTEMTQEAQATSAPADDASDETDAEQEFAEEEQARSASPPPTPTVELSPTPTPESTEIGGARATSPANRWAADLLRWVEIGLAGLVIVLAALTFRSRPQRR